MTEFEDELQSITARLEAFRVEHRDLDAVIKRVQKNPPFDQIQMIRLKKRKLWLKDQISWLEDQIYPDIIA